MSLLQQDPRYKNTTLRVNQPLAIGRNKETKQDPTKPLTFSLPLIRSHNTSSIILAYIACEKYLPKWDNLWKLIFVTCVITDQKGTVSPKLFYTYKEVTKRFNMNPFLSLIRPFINIMRLIRFIPRFCF